MLRNILNRYIYRQELRKGYVCLKCHTLKLLQFQLFVTYQFRIPTGAKEERQLQPKLFPGKITMAFFPFLCSSSGFLSRRERRDELAARPIFVARDTGMSRASHCSKRTTQFRNNATLASECATLCKRDANKQGQDRENGDGRGGPFYRYRAAARRALGFRNLEGHRFMSADVIYTYALNARERTHPRISRRMETLRRPFAICPLESIRLRNF